MPEHVVEGRDPANRRRRNLRGSADAAQRLLRQVTVMVLQGLKDRDDRIGRATDPLHRLIHVFQVKAHDGKSECRNPKAERRPKSEIRSPSPNIQTWPASGWQTQPG